MDYITTAQMHYRGNLHYKNDRQLSKSKIHLFKKVKVLNI